MIVGEPPGLPVPSATFDGIDHFRLHVRDIRESATWYRKVLGFGEAWYFRNLAILRHADSKIELVLGPREPGQTVGQSTFDHLAFRVETRGALAQWQERLRAMGLSSEITPAVGGVSINFEDPDGHDLELIVRESWPGENPESPLLSN